MKRSSRKRIKEMSEEAEAKDTKESEREQGEGRKTTPTDPPDPHPTFTGSITFEHYSRHLRIEEGDEGKGNAIADGAARRAAIKANKGKHGE
jgi:hypothetical protein